MSNKLSFSSIKTYTECGEKYRKHYIEGWREKYFHSALAYGSAIDKALNDLLETRELGKALKSFDVHWESQEIQRGTLTSIAMNENLVYADKDFDLDLLSKDDLRALSVYLNTNPSDIYVDPITQFDQLRDLKKQKGFDNLSSADKQYFNYVNWLCLRRKGHIMLKSYHKDILPKLKEVLAVQHEFSLSNEDGDSVIGFVDLIATWEDGRRLLLDNKTSAKDYDAGAASHSSQLILYYHKLKEQYALNGVGFIVMNKQIQKNKIKICRKCDFDGSGSRHKTCNNEVSGVRCNGEWVEHINPECNIQVQLDTITDRAEDLVLDSFDQANKAIKAGVFLKNLSACKTYSGLTCQFFNSCWHGNDSNLINVKK